MFFNWFSSSFMLYGIALNWQGLTGVDWNIYSMIDNNRKQLNIANSAIIFLINHWSVRIGSIGQSGPGGPGGPGCQCGAGGQGCLGGQGSPGDQMVYMVQRKLEMSRLWLTNWHTWESSAVFCLSRIRNLDKCDLN